MQVSVLFYRLFIDPRLNTLRTAIKGQIPGSSRCLDIACGTGSLVFFLATGCESVTGVDLNEAKIVAAQKRAALKGLDHLSFELADATDLSRYPDQTFNVASMALAVHQFPSNLRESISHEAMRVSDRLILADFAVPLPKTGYGNLAKWVEYLAGTEHYQNFRDYYRKGGMASLLDGMTISYKEISVSKAGVFKLWVIDS